MDSLRLIIEDDEGTTTIVPLGADSITIGRQQGNTIQLTEKNVSRRHARLTPDTDGWTIEDLNSYNGVKVNGQSADGRIALKEGDVIQIGDYHLALTEDVDKRTLNYEARDAANNDPAAEPLLASSSSDLPRLSPDELAALSSGPQTPQPAAMLMDSGPVPAATGLPAAYGDDSKRKGGAGLLIGVGVVVAVLAVGVGVWASSSGNDEPDKKVATSESGGGEKAPAVVAPKGLNANPASGSAGDPTAQPVDSGQAPPASGDDDGGADVEPSDPTAAVDDPTAGAQDSGGTSPKKPKKPRKKPKNTTRPTPSPTPSETGPDPENLLTDARKIQFKDPSRAYALAKQSYGIRRSQKALNVMAFTACRMGDASKAKSAISKLKGSAKDTMIESCRRAGVDV